MSQSVRRRSTLGLLGALLATASLASGCSSVASPGSATIAAQTSVPSPAAAPPTVGSTAPSIAASIGTATEASFAEWIEVQGFGGSSGLREINKLVKLENESPSAA